MSLKDSRIYMWVYKRLYHMKVVSAAKKVAKYLLLTRIYPNCYKKACKAKPLNPKKAVFIEVRHDYLTDNFELLFEEMKRRGYQPEPFYLQNIAGDYWGLLKRTKAMMEAIADAKYIFLNDACEDICRLKMRKGTVVTQVWHACGAFKKWGMSVADLKFGQTAKEQKRYGGYRNLDLVTVSSPEITWAYEEAMNLKAKDKIVQATGVSRTDIFFDETFKAKARQKVHEVFPASEGKKIILYAPTFRGRVAKAKAPRKLDFGALKENFGDEFVILCKHHPFIKKRPEIEDYYESFAKDVTEEMTIEELLCISDICISDYSSLVFEYSLFEKPMIFYAYDLENYFDWRGFFYDYYELAPGPIVSTTREMVEAIKSVKDDFDPTQVRAFRDKFMSACDGHATEKILDMVLNLKK